MLYLSTFFISSLPTEPDICFLTYSSTFCLEEFEIYFEIQYPEVSVLLKSSIGQSHDAYLMMLNEIVLPRRSLPSDFHLIQTCMQPVIVLIWSPLIHLILVRVALDLEFHTFLMLSFRTQKTHVSNFEVYCTFSRYQIFLRITHLLKA